MVWFAFKAGNEDLCIAAEYVHRVVDHLVPTPVPLVPPCHLGLVYDRGEVYDVIDMGLTSGKGRPARRQQASRVILLKGSNYRLALATDKIIGLVPAGVGTQEPSFVTCGTETFRVITPEGLWSLLMEMQYGPGQV